MTPQILASRPPSGRKKREKMCATCKLSKTTDQFRHDIVGELHCKASCIACEEKLWREIQAREKLRRRRIPPENVQVVNRD